MIYLFVVSIMNTKLDFGRPLYSNGFRYFRSAFFLSSLSLLSCVASLHSGLMLIEFERSPHVQEFSVASGGFLRLAVASLQDAFLLQSQTKEDLSVI